VKEIKKVPEKMPSIKRSMIIALSLFIVDAFILNQGVIAFIVLIIGLPVMTVKAIRKRKDGIQLRVRLIIMGIYALMVILVFMSNHLNNLMAEKHAEVIITACEQYKMKNGEYPPSLSVLVPEFIERVPDAKYTLSSNKFIYINDVRSNSHTLMFVEVPPFGRSYYVLEEKKWKYLD
jgi:hypothetical protein